ncbi:MAG: MATE family efflux transporter [Methanobrevibacter sp.]|jgi:putative MATE family efflux protein|nr:MATE family efflux transporter [Candidatus Methanovirga basalitermitum]
MSENPTEGVSTLYGDPKKAILKLSMPMMFAMFVSSLYALVDGIWVGGLGDLSIAAVGFINPLYLIVMGFSNGLGAGATSVISRYIGARDKKQVDNSGIHVLLLTAILSIMFTVVLTLLLHPILIYMSVDNRIMDISLSYGQILFLGSIFIVFTSTAYGILRAEGNVKKATYGLLIGSILNMILDPIFIYPMGLGVFGAGLASVLSLSFVSILLVYWFKKETYIDFSLKNFNFQWHLIKKILSVGIPAGTEMLIVAFLNFFLNSILLIVNDIQGVAVYNAGWRFVMVALVIPMAIGTSTVAVVGANYGAKKFENIKVIYNYSIKFGLLMVTLMAMFIFIFAPQISYLFAYLPGLADIRNLISEFLRVICLFYFFVPLGISASSVFQGVGKGLSSLFITAIRLLIFEIIFTYFLAIVCGFGQYGVWYGIVLGNGFGSVFAYFYTRRFIKKLNKKESIV